MYSKLGNNNYFEGPFFHLQKESLEDFILSIQEEQ